MKKKIISIILAAALTAGNVALAAVETKGLGSWKIQYTYTSDETRAMLDSEITNESSQKFDGGDNYSSGTHGLSLVYLGNSSGTYVSAITTLDGSWVKPGKKYRLSLKRRSFMAFGSTVKITGGVAEEVSADVNIDWGEGWTGYSYEFTADDSGDDIIIELRFTRGNAEFGGARLFIDDVTCYMLDDDGNETGENLIVNGGFEDSTSNVSSAKPVENVNADGKIGAVKITWDNPADENFLKAKIYILNGTQKQEIVTLKKGENEYTVENLEDGREYTFLIVSLDNKFVETDGVKVSCSTVEAPEAPDVSADIENEKIIGIDESMEYKIDLGEWKSYTSSSKINLSGNHIVCVRKKATADAPAGKSTILIFQKAEEIVSDKVTFTKIVQKNGKLILSGLVSNADRAEVLISLKNIETEEYLFVKQVETDKKGVFSLEIGLSDEINGMDMTGTYKLKANSDQGLLSDESTVVFGNADKRKAAIEKINSAMTENDIADLFKDDSEYLNGLYSLGFYADKYSGEYKKVIDGYLLDKLKAGRFNADDEESFSTEVDKANLLYKINAENDIAELQKLLVENDNITGLEFTKLLSEGIDDKINWVLGKIAADSFVTYEELVQKNKLYGALYSVNNATYMNIERVLSENADVFALENNTEYAKYKTLTDKTETNKNMITYIGKNKLQNAADVILCISKSITTQQSTGGGGSSSGGSSSKGSSSGFPASGNTITQGKDTFADIKDAAWAADAINALYKKNIISGYGDNTVHPNDMVTREQFIKMAVSAFEITAGINNNAFKDIVPGAWYEQYVNTAYSAGIVSGISDNQFGIGQYLTREDMAVLICRIAEHKNMDIGKITDKEFSDWDSIADYAKDAVKKLADGKIINGTSETEFSPKGYATRAQCAVIIYNIIK